MTNYSYILDPGIVEVIKKIAASLDENHPMEGKVVDVDGSYANVRTAGKGTILRHCPVIGDAGTLVPGQLVGLRWINERPFVLATSQPTSAITQQTFQPDGVTLENSPYGIRIIPGSVRLSHLGFFPALEGHTHGDSLTMNGWSVDSDGVISQGDVNIHPTGQISLGLSPNVIKLDAQHSTHRIWVGDVLPANADFSVEKDGKMNASAGTIAGWDILAAKLSKNGAELRAAGELVLGSGNDVFFASAVDVDDYRLWIGHADPDLAPFRVKKTGETWLTNAHIMMDLESSGYVSGQQGWHIDQDGWAEFQDITIRGSIEAVTFKNSVTSVLSGRQIVTDGATFIADVAATDSTIDVDTNIFEVDDILQSQPTPTKSEWMSVTAGPSSITGGYRYTVIRDLAGGSEYADTVQSLIGAENFAAYWKFAEIVGTNADDLTTNANDGTYIGPTLNDGSLPVNVGGKAPYYDGVNDRTNISAVTGEVDGEEGFISLWAKGATGWLTDGTQHFLINLHQDPNNFIYLSKSATNNIMVFYYRANGVIKLYQPTFTLPETDWFHIAIVWSYSGDFVKCYLNGSQIGSTMTSLGQWVPGTWNTDRVCVGDYHHTAPNAPWKGHIGHVMVGTTAISGTDVMNIYNASASGQPFYTGENIFRKGLATYPEETPMMGTHTMAMGYSTAFMGISPFTALGGFLSMEGSRQYGPYFGVARRFGADYNQILDVVRLGRLKGFLGITADDYGIAIGDNNRNLIYSYAGGLSLKTRSGMTRIDDDGIATDAFALLPDTAPDYIDGRGLFYIDSATKKLRLRYKDSTYESDTIIASL